MFKFFKKKNKADIKNIELPKHVGIIMDGNGRWAKKRGLPRTAGHSVGANKCREIAKYCDKIGIKYLTLYAFSTENWKRPEEEVKTLMRIFKDFIKDSLENFENTIKMNFIGDLEPLDSEIKELIETAENRSKTNPGTVCNIAVNYGGRNEIVSAVKKISTDVKSGKLNIEDIDEDMVSGNIYTAGQPDPDIIIRTGGEHRTSNFLLWQSAYAEYFIENTMWPEFNADKLNVILKEFSERDRRHGGI